MHEAKVAFVTSYPEYEVKPLIEAAPRELYVYHVDKNLPAGKRILLLRDADFLLLLPADITIEDVRSCPNLKLIQLFSAGYDRIDVKSISGIGIPVANNGGRNATAVAEFTIALILNVFKRFLHLAKNMDDGKWATSIWKSSYDLKGKTVGIVGLGSIGWKVAARLHAFDVKILAYYDPKHAPKRQATDLGIQMVDLEVLLRKSDIVSLHIPLTPETEDFIGENELAKMKSTAILINTSRGGVVDEAALYEALRNNKIAGAALDVLKREPVTAENPLKNLDNVIITPHVASCTLDSRMQCTSFAYENMLRILNGEEPINVIKI